MSRKNVLIVVGVVLLGAAVVAANLYFRKDKGLAVTTEQIRARDLEAIVSASGKIQAERTVNVSSDTVGRVVNLAVNEGDRVTKGQFLLQIDPKTLRSRVDNEEASLKGAEVTLEQMRQAVGNRQGAAGTGAPESQAAAGPLESAADDPRSARQGGERREGRRVVAGRARQDRPMRRPRASRRSARISTARGTT